VFELTQLSTVSSHSTHDIGLLYAVRHTGLHDLHAWYRPFRELPKTNIAQFSRPILAYSLAVRQAVRKKETSHNNFHCKPLVNNTNSVLSYDEVAVLTLCAEATKFQMAVFKMIAKIFAGFLLVISSRNRVPGTGSKILTRLQIRVTTGTGFPPQSYKIPPILACRAYLHLFMTLNSILAPMYFRLHIHKLYRSITRRAFSETTNIMLWCPRSPKLWFSLLTFVTYLRQMEFETGSGYPANCNKVPCS